MLNSLYILYSSFINMYVMLSKQAYVHLEKLNNYFLWLLTLNENNPDFSMKTSLFKWKPDVDGAVDEYKKAGK